MSQGRHRSDQPTRASEMAARNQQATARPKPPTLQKQPQHQLTKRTTLKTLTRKTSLCCWRKMSTQTNVDAPALTRQRRVAVASSCSIVILLLACSLQPASSQQQPQYRQRSPIYQQQQQQQASSQLVNNLQAAYQNDQPARPYQAPVDLDNVIESTTTNSSPLQHQQQQQQQAFPLLSNIAARPLYQQQQQQQQQQTCQLPVTWAGRWFQANKDTVRVTNSEISDKGLCRDRKGDKFLFESAPKPGQQAPCLVCMVIHERHLNVLQYKESACQPMPAQYLNRTSGLDNDHSLLENICSDIVGDAALESMFRLDTPATECPIGGKYQFTYDTCREPLSSLDSCIDRKQLNFKFSACQDVGESKSEVLKCYADWSEGNNYYMIGRLEHASNQQDKGKFRCFVYEKSPDGEYIQMAQSLEESCNGLINANEGPKTLRLSARQPASGNKCHFPSYIQGQSESWLSVDNSLIYMFNANSSKYQVKETREGNVIEEADCLEQVRHPHAQSSQHQLVAHALHHQARSNQQPTASPPSSRRYPPSSNHFNQIDPSHQVPPATSASSSRQTINDVVYLVQITKNCYTTDYCVRFYRRTNGIVQIDYFIALPGSDGQQRCRNAFVGAPQTQIITSTNLEQQRCPFDGAYTIEAPLESDFSYNPSNIFICPRQSYLTAQCDNPNRLRVHYRCSPAKYMIKNLYCLGSWTTGSLVRLLLADDERQRYSAWYRDYATAAAAGPAQEEAGQPGGALTRSQQLLALSPATAAPTSAAGAALSPSLSPSAAQQSSNSIASIVDLQIALITAQPGVSKPMQVRLTRRSQCSDLRGYSNQGSFSSMSGASVPSYASPSASSAAGPSLGKRALLLQAPAHLAALVCSLLLLVWQAVAPLHERRVWLSVS